MSNFNNVQHFIFFDFETSGLRSKGFPQVPTQLCFIVTDADGKIVEKFDHLLKGATILSDWVITNCPHVSLTKLETEGMQREKAWKKLLKYVSYSSVYVAHNASFDWGIVLEYAKDLVTKEGYKKLLHQRVFCTKDGSTNKCKIPKQGKSAYYPGWKWPTLQEMVIRLMYLLVMNSNSFTTSYSFTD